MLIDKDLYNNFFKKDNRDNFINVDINSFELFNELQASGKLKGTRHKTFAFSYYWLVSYLWKYSKYGYREINAQDIKRILGVNPTEKRLDYIIKKKGVLDSVGLTETTRDFPINTTMSEEGIKVTTLSSLDEEIAQDFSKRYGSRYVCKKPLLQYERDGKVGLMFSKDDTLSISVFEFTRCVLCPEIGFDGFYVYAYLKYRIKMLGNQGVNIYYAELERQIGYKHRRVRSLIQNLVLAGLIDVKTEMKHEEGKIVQNNTYNTIYKGKQS